MSFLSAVGHFFQGAGRDIEKVTNVIQPYAPLISALPVIGGPFGMIFHYVLSVEQIVGDAAKKGSDKKAAVTQMVLLAYPSIDKAALGLAIDGIVKILNDLTKAVPALPPPTIVVAPGQ